ncbi:TetR/AcrR family transcriptional regulator [Paenibacillus sp. LPE1-1-1.1]|uniref:TetR/AcrR family transcriptional regulator n=1 Tax=Paenibacillus sp. LPE1-1-1.1 TaxID=3135230 RepID=UPI003438F188
MAAHSGAQDRRISRTRQMIQESMIVLILEKGFEKISVKDIADHANVNRSTFYAHFQDKFELLDKVIEEKLLVLSDSLHNVNNRFLVTKLRFDEPDPFLSVLFAHIAESLKFYQAMFTHLEKDAFTIKIQKVIREALYERISGLKMEQRLSVPLDIVLDYASFSILGVAQNWLKNDTVFSPHHMALQLTRLSSLGIYKAIGVEQ